MKHDVYIYNAGGEYRVRPTLIELIKTGASNLPPLKVRNATSETVLLIFPQGTLAPAVGLTGDTVQFAAQEKKPIQFNVPASPTSFSFSVCVVAKDGGVVKAKAESDPILIIDD